MAQVLPSRPALPEAESADRPEGASVRSKRQGYKDFNCVQMRALPNVAQRSWVSGFNSHYEFVLATGVRAKTVTSNLPLLTVL